MRGRMGIVAMLALVTVVTASCDVVTASEPLTLQAKTVSFRFEFSSDGVDPGETVEVQSEESANLGPDLSADGFTKAEVLSATVTAVELERISPATVDLNFLDEAQLSFTASGVSARTVATSSSLPSARTASLPLSNTDVTTFVVAPTFRAALAVVPATVPQAGFVLRANVTLRIRVEGI